MSPHRPLGLFEGYGVELEYVIVATETLSVLPIADEVLRAVAGKYVSEVNLGEMSLSNELVLHLIELKNTEPSPRLAALSEAFQRQVRDLDRMLAPLGGMLMPTGMHPWMSPERETRLWPRAGRSIYRTFDRVFGCRSHGWANLQSVQLNLPFADDREFARLHAAVRLLLPVMPALAASSPIMEGVVTGLADTRLEVYRTNSARIPSVTGSVIPEPVFSRAHYRRRILNRIYHDLRPHDPEGILRHEWVNARGAIAHFDRDAIEIRVLDMQECPVADIAICMVVTAVLKALVSERWADLAHQQSWAVEPLSHIFLAVVRDGERAELVDGSYLKALGFPGKRATAGELWRHLIETTSAWESPTDRVLAEAIDVILNEGPLSRRIGRAVGGNGSREATLAVYRELCRCLVSGELFRAL